jgi:hypothetical protein
MPARQMPPTTRARGALREEARGWRDALTSRAALLTMLRWALVGATLSFWGAVIAEYADVAVVVLASAGVALGAYLARLRLTGRP